MTKPSGLRSIFFLAASLLPRGSIKLRRRARSLLKQKLNSSATENILKVSPSASTLAFYNCKRAVKIQGGCIHFLGIARKYTRNLNN